MSLIQKLRTGSGEILVMAATGVLTLLAFEIVLRFLPVAWSPPVEPPTLEYPIQRYAANSAFTWSIGWDFSTVVHGRSNAQGFLADYDYDASATSPLVAVIGDSMIEALRVPFADTITGRLQARLGTAGRAYAFAQSGVPISQYVAYAGHACAVYKPDRLVVSVVGNDFDQSIYAHRARDGLFHLYPTPEGAFDYKLTPLPPPRFIERVLRNSALALYLARNGGLAGLIDWFRPRQANAETELQRYVGYTEAAAPPQRVDEGFRVIEWFVNALAPAACLSPDKIVIVVDAPRPHLYSPSDLAYAHTSYFGQMRRRLIDVAKSRGYNVVDMEPYFLATYATNGEPFEFKNDPHWSGYGHAVVTRAILEALADWLPLSAAGTPFRKPR